MTRYRPDLDGLRAVAIVAVVLFHAFPQALPGGFIGVDVFFVISGFLIGGLLLEAMASGSLSVRHFYARRIKRLFPALIIVLAAVFVFAWRRLLIVEMASFGKDLVASALFAGNLSLMGEAGYFDRDTALKPLMHLWSLGIEEQFYLVWPWLMLGVTKLKRLGFIALGLLALASCAYGVFLTANDEASRAFYSPLSRGWELICGTLLAWVLRRAPHDTKPALSWVGLALISVSAFAFNSQTQWMHLWLTVPVLGAALVIWAGRNRLLASRPFVGIGRISYSTYLWHWPLFSGARILNGAELTSLTLAVLALASFALGALTLVLIENPIRRSPTRLAVIAPMMGMAVLVALGLFALASGGIPSRYPPMIREIISAKFTVQDQYRTGRCFAVESQNESMFRPECLETVRPLVFLWGDSQAAALYPGFHVMQNIHHYGIAQYTATACPALVGVENHRRANCKRINDHVIEVIEQSKPNMVLLEAGWFFEGYQHEYGLSYDATALTETVRRLERAGIEHIVLMGTAPTWPEGGVRRALYDEWAKHSLDAELPLRVVPRNWETMKRSDSLARATAEAMQLEYISVIDVLCNEDGCLTRVGPKSTDITSADTFHLTPAASIFVVNRLFETGQLSALTTQQ